MSYDSLDREAVPEDRDLAGEYQSSNTGEPPLQSPTDILQSRTRGTLSYIDEETQSALDLAKYELENTRQTYEYLVERCMATAFPGGQSVPELESALAFYVAYNFEDLESKLAEAYDLSVMGEFREARRLVEEVKRLMQPLISRNEAITSAMSTLADEGCMRAL